MSVPDYPLEETIDFKFTSRAFATGIPTVLAGTPTVEIYEDNTVTQITAAETLTVDFDSVVGLNNLRVVATAANGFESGKSYQCVLSAGTVGGVSVVGEVVAQFSIERSPAPTVAQMNARTLVAAGYATPTNITAGTITTVTNLTNAPTSGDLTATMKASINTEADTALSDWNKTGFSLAADQSGVTIGTVTTNTDMRGTDNASTHDAAAVLTALGTGSWITAQVNLKTATQASIDAIEADTNELQTDDVPTLIAATEAKVDIIDALIDKMAPRLIGTLTGAGLGTEVCAYGGVTVTYTVDGSGNISAAVVS